MDQKTSWREKVCPHLGRAQRALVTTLGGRNELQWPGGGCKQRVVPGASPPFGLLILAVAMALRAAAYAWSRLLAASLRTFFWAVVSSLVVFGGMSSSLESRCWSRRSLLDGSSGHCQASP